MDEITTFSGESTRLDDASTLEQNVSSLLLQVGERVRDARERKGIPRRVLSEISGVSPRYLAQLEVGQGNISIGLLKRVAVALDHKIEWLVGDEDPWTSEALQVAEKFRSADRGTKDKVLHALSPENSANARSERVCLIGLRGAGKSTLGRLAAEKLEVPFLELNKEIELHGGMPVGEVMALYGQEGYRKLESDALDRVVASHDRVVLAVAGGVVAEPPTFSKLLAKFHTVWIKASAIEHMNRVSAQGDERPMAGNPEAMDQLQSILRSREALYQRAEAHLDTSGASLDVSLAQLLEIIARRKFLRLAD